MLTKWAKDVLTMSLSDNVLFSVENNAAGKHAVIEAKTMGNSSIYMAWYSYSHGYGAMITSPGDTSGDGIYLGSGTTTPTENDYSLETPITSGITATTTRNNMYDSENNRTFVRIAITVTNTGSSPVTISEVGKANQFDTANAIGTVVGSPRKTVLVDHTVLENPVTIPAGEGGVIFYDFVYFDGSDAPTVSAKAKK